MREVQGASWGTQRKTVSLKASLCGILAFKLTVFDSFAPERSWSYSRRWGAPADGGPPRGHPRTSPAALGPEEGVRAHSRAFSGSNDVPQRTFGRLGEKRDISGPVWHGSSAKAPTSVTRRILAFTSIFFDEKLWRESISTHSALLRQRLCHVRHQKLRGRPSHATAGIWQITHISAQKSTTPSSKPNQHVNSRYQHKYLRVCAQFWQRHRRQ